MDFNAERERMVREDLVGRGVSDPAVLLAFKKVPRERFVPDSLRRLAYIDSPLDIGEDQTISQPYTVARMTELLELNSSDKVLEIGTGSGYQAAILAEIVKNGFVYTIERLSALASTAKKTLRELNYNNIEVIVGDGSRGLPEKSPFNAIIITAGAPKIPQPLLNQLAVGGRLIIPVGSEYGQEMTRVTKLKSDEFKTESFGLFRFVPLIGEYSWE